MFFYVNMFTQKENLFVHKIVWLSTYFWFSDQIFVVWTKYFLLTKNILLDPPNYFIFIININ